jgi:hypothetical protein
MKNVGHNSLVSGMDSNQVPPEIEALVCGNAESKTCVYRKCFSADKYRLSACKIHCDRLVVSI